MMIDSLKALLNKRGETVSVAESLTAGKIQNALASVSGASSFFEGGITAYSLTQKVLHLGVDHFHAKEVNCVSDRVAKEMAEGVCHKFQTDYSISTTGYAEAWPSEGVKEPLAHIAIYSKEEQRVVAASALEVVTVNGERKMKEVTFYISGESLEETTIPRHHEDPFGREGFREWVTITSMSMLLSHIACNAKTKNI